MSLFQIKLLFILINIPFIVFFVPFIGNKQHMSFKDITKICCINPLAKAISNLRYQI
jgi:hypothetical protein